MSNESDTTFTERYSISIFAGLSVVAMGAIFYTIILPWLRIVNDGLLR
jgi:hypothetical protein